jgi:hypothetical protein
MSQQWQVDGPKVIDVGDENERVRRVVVALVGGTVDVVTHDDSPTARVEVSSVEGLPLQVSWDGRTLKVMHGKDADETVWDALRRLMERWGRNSAVVSISVPSGASATVSTMSASAVIGGLRNGLTANTVSGGLTLGDIHGRIVANTVSGAVECADLVGDAWLNSVSGAVTVRSSDIPKAKINTVSGDIALDLNNAVGRVSSNSVSADVTVRAPFTGYAVTASSATGQVVIDGQSLGRRAAHQPGPGGGTLRSGDESMQLKANAVSGNIVLLRAQGTGNPPPPADAPYPQDAPPQDWSPTGSEE